MVLLRQEHFNPFGAGTLRENLGICHNPCFHLRCSKKRHAPKSSGNSLDPLANVIDHELVAYLGHELIWQTR
jgi:hypothetical protein